LKTEINREKKLPAFEMSLVEADLLIESIRNHAFDRALPVTIEIEIKHRQETLRFESISEMTNHSSLDSRELKFSLLMVQGENSLAIKSEQLLAAHPVALAKGSTAVWCAGAIEAVAISLARRHIWYGLFIQSRVMVTAVVLFGGSLLWWVDSIKPAKLPEKAGWLVIATIGLMMLLAHFRSTIFPAAVLHIRREENFLKRKGAEITVIATVVAAFAAVLGLFIGK
jgi:hypothetical protein